MSELKIIETGEATGLLPVLGGARKPVTVIGTREIREGFDAHCLQQAENSAAAPGVAKLVLNPDGHAGYGAPVGSVLASPTHIYPGPVGVDIKCSMSLLQTNLPVAEIASKETRRALINAICDRIPTGAGKGQRSVRKSRRIDEEVGFKAIVEGASDAVCRAIGIPLEWASRCEDAYHVGHDDTHDSLGNRLIEHLDKHQISKFDEKVMQLGSYGGGNHFGECEAVEFQDDALAESFGMKNGCVAFLSHCGSRGLGHTLATHQFHALQRRFDLWGTPFPASDKQLVYAPLGTPEADAYLDDMALGANFATANHMLINALVLEAFQEVIPGAEGWLVYFISHNIARKEVVDNQIMWVHRKGATRAFPKRHHELINTPFYETGHPILLPGNPISGSSVMVADTGAEFGCFSVNHGAGRAMGRKNAIRTLDQKEVDAEMLSHDILSNCREYPLDESRAAYKSFEEVLKSVELAGLARPVAKLKARFVIKDGSPADD